MTRWQPLLTIAAVYFSLQKPTHKSPPEADPSQSAERASWMPYHADDSDQDASTWRLDVTAELKEGKITDAQIQRELMSGNLQQTIKS